ncbi:MAG: glycosyltransferase family protein, partial [Hyphomicrobiaceae bacterium]
MDAGLEVTVAFGGMPVPNVDFGNAVIVQLPPVRASDARFTALVDADGHTPGDAWWDERISTLLDLHARLQPGIILIEHFPFGRRKFRRELVPLFEQARRKTDCRIIGSVRDILVESSDPAKTAEAIDIAGTWFDQILVHGDLAVIRLEDSFPAAAQMADRLSYTGYVVEERTGQSIPDSDGDGEVIVSAGGGAVGEILFRTALEARLAGCLADKTWRFLAGRNLDAGVIADLRRQAPQDVIIEPVRSDFRELLA